MYSSLYGSLTQYFGTQPMTSGPVYVGAFVLFLFVLGCFIVKGPLKWALIGATFFSIVLSWGKNFMPLTDFFIDYVPLYNQVPRRVLHPCHSRVHDTFAGYLCPENACSKSRKS